MMVEGIIWKTPSTVISLNMFKYLGIPATFIFRQIDTYRRESKTRHHMDQTFESNKQNSHIPGTPLHANMGTTNRWITYSLFFHHQIRMPDNDMIMS